MHAQYDILRKAADAVADKLGHAPVGVVLGSGLGEALDNLEHPQMMDYEDIPGLPTTTVAGHRGVVLHGRFGDTSVLALCGRVHMYEGRPVEDVAAGVRLLSLLGVHAMVVTSAVGSMDPELRPGALMLVDDHVNLSGTNVLAGAHDDRLGPRFTDMSTTYDRDFATLLERTSEQAGVSMSRGVLAQFLGPSYETPAEVAVARKAGARVVSMSMVPEVLVARQRAMRVVGIACVTNMAAGLSDRPLSHEDVLKGRAGVCSDLGTLLSGALPRMAG